jgi:hypothetical protein
MPSGIASYVHPDPSMQIGKPEAIFTISFDIGRSNSSLIVFMIASEQKISIFIVFFL